ncbi:50S ribosomal protein L29 [Candidatus Woesearchaeota archaeon]|nr:50S ribosomal protein L29 [Candidatus Woesearchaeota archaeon]
MSKRTKDFSSMNEAQLKDKLAELRLELMKQNAQVATGTIPKSPGLIRQTKRNIARILTLLNKKFGGSETKYE